jgi:hypothetical protein
MVENEPIIARMISLFVKKHCMKTTVTVGPFYFRQSKLKTLDIGESINEI